jgi:hypothetical protein
LLFHNSFQLHLNTSISIMLLFLFTNILITKLSYLHKLATYLLQHHRFITTPLELIPLSTFFPITGIAMPDSKLYIFKPQQFGTSYQSLFDPHILFPSLNPP